MSSTNGSHIALELEDSRAEKKITENHRAKSEERQNGRHRVLRAVPETDDDDEYDDRPQALDDQFGVDDGLLQKDDIPPPTHSDPKPPSTPRRPSFAFPGYDGTDMVDINGVPTQIPDVNAYQHKKTLAQGMMDLALLSANANQLRYVMDASANHPYYYTSLIFISLSIIFQIAVGVGLIWNSRFNIRNKKEICYANKVNNYTVIGIFIITVVNVFIAAFWGGPDKVGQT